MMRCKVCGKEYSGWGRYAKDCCSRECTEQARRNSGDDRFSTPVLIVIPRRLYLSGGMEPETGAIYEAARINNKVGTGFRYRITVRGKPLLLKPSDCIEVKLNVECVEDHGIRLKPGWNDKVNARFARSRFGR